MKDERESVDENGLITMTLESGRLRLVSRLQDYANRGDSLESFSLLRFVRDTYNGTKLKPSAIDGSGSRSSERCFYLDSTDDTSKCRVVRRAGHQTIVEFVGGYIKSMVTVHLLSIDLGVLWLLWTQKRSNF